MADLADRQAAASIQGADFESAVETILKIEGWEILDRKFRHPEVDIEIDLVAREPLTGETWWIECKGSWEGVRPGLRRTDTTKKALFNGAMLALVADRCPYMIVASHGPSPNSAGAVWVDRVRDIYYDRLWIIDSR